MSYIGFGQYRLPDGTVGSQAKLNQFYQQQQAQPQAPALPQGLAPDSAALNPFTSASAGMATHLNEDGTTTQKNNNMGGVALQDFLNRRNQSATDALYGGLSNYKPQSMRVGSANANYAYNSTPPSTDPMGLLGGGFGKRSWMTEGQQGLLGGYQPFQAGSVKMVDDVQTRHPGATGTGGTGDPLYASPADMPVELQQQLKQMTQKKQSALDNLMSFAPEYFANLKRG